MNKNIVFMSAFGALAVLSGCQSTGPVAPQATVKPQPRPTPPPVKPQPAPKPVVAAKPGAELNGNWIPTDAAAKGVYVAQFRDGVFASRSPSTKKLLAKGSYKIVSGSKVDLKFVGAATNTAVSASCDRKSTNTMYCVPTIGSPFNLKRT